MEWFGFWIFLSVCVAVDGWLYSKGHNTMFFSHKTDAEKELQRAAVDRAKKEAGGAHDPI